VAVVGQVFISYSSKDDKVARTICSALEGRGLSCWVASRDVGPGENFMDAIVQAIQASKVMVLVFSENANNSDDIKRELVLAGNAKLTVVPVRVENVVPRGSFAYQLATRQWIDLFEDWESQVERLAKWICDIVAVNAPVAPEARTAHPRPDAEVEQRADAEREHKQADADAEAQRLAEVRQQQEIEAKERADADERQKQAQAEVESKAKAEAEARQRAATEARRRAETDARQKAEQERAAAAAASAAAAMNISPAAAVQPVPSARPQTSKQMILVLAGVLATALLIEPTVLSAYGYSYKRSDDATLGLVIGVINCIIAAGLVILWQRARRVVLGLYAFGILMNGFFSLAIAGPKPHLGLVSLLYFIVCLATFVVVWRARPSPAPAKDQGAPAGEPQA
jgi:hypothetical protein